MTSIIESKDLKEFLKDSVSTHENKTIKFYHATRYNKEIKRFLLDSNGCAYFSTSPDIALTFTDLRYRKNIKYKQFSENIYEVHLNIKNVFNSRDSLSLKKVEKFFRKNLEEIVFRYLKAQLIEFYGMEIGNDLNILLCQKLNIKILKELRDDGRVMEECLSLYESLLRRNSTFAFKKLYEIISSEHGWLIFEKVFPESMKYIKELGYDSFITYENVDDDLNFNIAVFSPNQISIVDNYSKKDYLASIKNT